ncbi:hypothetical protein BJ322DRAFT_1005805 [Thelephora terrestris]|uniref:VPS9 domain-containing protein n=1 Tax=Thelephora terrestris TaxID=56493 RepID=A0A9P6HFU4_9AGAM|nr:hypothetical protein BJ322DRAFT_1005805 [Thelephora terrestris]
MASSSSSNPDLSKVFDSLSLSEKIDPWSRPIDDNDPDDPPLTANPPTTSSNSVHPDNTPPHPDRPPPILSDTSPFSSSSPIVHVDQAVLDEFDPLGTKIEQEAKQAWEQSEHHPPVVPPKSPPVQPELPTQDRPTSPPPTTQPPPPPAPIPVPGPSVSRSTTPSLSGLAAIARNFIPISPVRNPRPLSIDQASVLPSPTVATFGASIRDQGATHKRSQSLGPASRPSNPEAQLRHDDSRPQTPGSAPRTPKSATKDIDKDHPPQFDFQLFLEQIKSKGAEPVAKYLRSFLANFAKRTFTVNDQVKLIHDFLNAKCEVWKAATAAEFDNALEGMEKLVMNRLYDYTFSPQIPRLIPPRQVTTDDLERDRVLAQRMALFGWIEEKHLDVPEEDGSKGFLMFAQQELLKINHYKAPRDKLICVLNCCKVIFGLLKHLQKEGGADSFLPILIFVVLKANPEHMLSNVEFINRFRNPAKLQSEAGYYLSSLMGAISFIETMDHTALSNITQEEFEENIESVVNSLPEDVPGNRPTAQSLLTATAAPNPVISRVGTPISTFHVGEESAEPINGLTPQALGEDAKRLLQKTGDAVSKPLNALGRIFSEALGDAEDQLRFLPFGGDGGQYPGQAQNQPGPTHGQYETPLHQTGGQIQTPYKPRIKRVNSPMTPPLGGGGGGSSQGQQRQSWHESPTRTYTYSNRPLVTSQGDTPGRSPSPAPSKLQSLLGFGFGDAQQQSQTQPQSSSTPDIQILQAEIDRAHRQQSEASKGTLRQIFPEVDEEVLEWVLEGSEGQLERSIEMLLEITSGG